jgi:O-glycosyl hydrolase
MRESVLLLSILQASCAEAQTITINWGDVYQTIDGFGAASLSTEVTLTSNQADFFYTNSGSSIGLTIIRVREYPDYADCVANEDGLPCVNAARATISEYDLANAQAAYARGAKVWTVSYSPPGSMKSNGSYSTGGSMIGNSTNYTNLAAIQASFVTLLTGTYGIPIYAFSIQNEPDTSAGYPSCTWTAT